MRHFSDRALLDAPTSDAARLIDFETAKVVPGFINDTWILVVTGTKPYLNMKVELVPMIYIDRPEYWKIEIVGILPGIGLPALGPYATHLDLTGVTGTRGIELVGATKSLKIDVPPGSESSGNIGFWTAAIDNSGAKPQIIVIGRFPTNGEEPVFELTKAEPQGTNPTELILELRFGDLVDPKGSGEGTARYEAIADETSPYRTVLIRDPNGRTIANVEVVR